MKKRLADLVDLDEFSSMMASFYDATGIPYGLLDTDNNILCGIGWQEICTGFHRVSPACLARCHESDRYIADHLHAVPYLGYRCANGLMDYAAPIVIDGEHQATMFFGQFLHEPPDLDFFRRHAAAHGFDEDAYLAAVAKVPIVPREKAEAAMAFFAKMARMLATVGMTRLRHLETEAKLVELNETLETRIETNHALVQEIAEEKRAEQHLRRERDFSHAVINSLPGVFYLLDTQGRFLLWNRNMETLLGYAPAELENLPALDLFRGADKERVAERIGQVFRDGQASVEATIHAKDGRGTPHLFTGLRVILDGAPRLVGLGIDISDRLRAEEALGEKATALERSNQELEQFAYVASHDLREPLRMVTSYMSLLERRYAERLGEDAREFIGYAREGALRMDRLILDLLEYSRVGRTGGGMGPLSGADVVTRAVANLAIAIDEAQAEVQIPDQFPQLHGHQEELTRLFQNIIGNAIKYRRDGEHPLVRVTCEQREDAYLFAISDNGIGIAPEYAERVFQIFQRLHTRDQYEGTGIGLAICKKIVERHGGRLWLASAPSEGSTFFFTLPRPRG